jgi:hypothetical protein
LVSRLKPIVTAKIRKHHSFSAPRHPRPDGRGPIVVFAASGPVNGFRGRAPMNLAPLSGPLRGFGPSFRFGILWGQIKFQFNSLRRRANPALMPSKRPLMKLSRDEDVFLRHWMYDEVRYGEGPGPAKLLQLQHQAVPADLAILIAASMPDPADQEAAGLGPPPAEPPVWPWPEGTLRVRLADARAALALVDASPRPGSDVGPGPSWCVREQC